MMSSGPISLYDFRKNCRACLRKSSNLISLDKSYNAFAKNKSEFVEAGVTIGTVLMSCASIQIANDDGLPRKVCTMCVMGIREAFNFRRMCQNADNKLRDLLRAHLTNASVKLQRVDAGQESCEPNGFDAKPLERNLDIGEGRRTSIESKSSTEFWSDEFAPRSQDPLHVEEAEVSHKFFDARGKPTANTDTPFARYDECESEEKQKRRGGGNPNRFVDAKIARNEPIASTDISFESYEEWKSKQKQNRKRRKKKKTDADKEKPVQKYMCEICSKAVTDIQSHSIVHSAERNYECDICKRKYKVKGSLKEHMRSHMSEEQLYKYLCPTCGNKYRTSTVLKEHMRVHTNEKPYKCEQCGKAWRTKGKLNVHSRVHIKPHVCTICGKRFPNKPNWKCHMMMHAGDLPHKCIYCDAAFTRSSTLKIHMRGHTGENPFQCKVCGEYFRETRQLAKHMQSCNI